MPSRVLSEIPLDGGFRLELAVDDSVPRRPVRQTVRGPRGGDAATIADPAFAAALLGAMGVPGGVTSAAVLRGEQTNTSIVVGRPDDAELVVKLFRTVQHGENPDVELQRVLSQAGADFVPGFAGALEAEWPNPDGAAGRGHLAVAQEFVRGATDGWVLATRAAAAGDDFTDRAREVGGVTARMHAVLADRLPTRSATPDDIATQAALWRTRFDDAAAAVASLVTARPAIEAAYATASRMPWPPLQRIHGDLHLGQLLHRDARWVVLDFEGEPLRSLAERVAPEPALRDVAGMLRSFDYAARQRRPWRPEWARRCREAFCAGYAARAGWDPRKKHALLRAHETDRAVYEVLYEARHRPDWLPVPMAAIRRLAVWGG
jgi:maltokinase